MNTMLIFDFLDYGTCSFQVGARLEEPFLDTVHIKKDAGRHKQRDDLGKDHAADHHQAEGDAGGGIGAVPQGNGHGPQDGAQAGHQDRAEAHETGVVNRVVTVHALGPALFGKVHHQNAVLGDQPDEHEHADIAVNRKLTAERQQGQQAAKDRHRQGGENREGMDITFI